MAKKIIFNSNSDYNLYLFRQGIMKRMKDDGWEVHAVCPLGNYEDELRKDGIYMHNINLSRHGKNPFRDIVYLIRLYRIFHSIRPSIVHSFTVKPNIYGNLAAAFAGVPKRINTVSGLGYVYIGSNIKKKILRAIVNLLYKIAFLFSHKVIFQNDEDCELFTMQYHIVPKEKTTVIRSSGVDCDFFSMQTVDRERLKKLRSQFGIAEDAFVVLMAARMIWEKGVKEFVEAAKIVKNEHPEVIFLLVGSLEHGNPSAVSENYLLSHKNDVQWIGHQKDMKHILALASIVVLPSYYREGVPRILLEAMAMGKPILTTDSVGCREVIKNGNNGFIIDIKSYNDIARKILILISNSDLTREMGSNGIHDAQKKFNHQIVINEHILHYES